MSQAQGQAASFAPQGPNLTILNTMTNKNLGFQGFQRPSQFTPVPQLQGNAHILQSSQGNPSTYPQVKHVSPQPQQQLETQQEQQHMQQQGQVKSLGPGMGSNSEGASLASRQQANPINHQLNQQRTAPHSLLQQQLLHQGMGMAGTAANQGQQGSGSEGGFSQQMTQNPSSFSQLLGQVPAGPAGFMPSQPGVPAGAGQLPAGLGGLVNFPSGTSGNTSALSDLWRQAMTNAYSMTGGAAQPKAPPTSMEELQSQLLSNFSFLSPMLSLAPGGAQPQPGGQGGVQRPTASTQNGAPPSYNGTAGGAQTIAGPPSMAHLPPGFNPAALLALSAAAGGILPLGMQMGAATSLPPGSITPTLMGAVGGGLGQAPGGGATPPTGPGTFSVSPETPAHDQEPADEKRNEEEAGLTGGRAVF
eukprot:gene10747-17823_t